MDNFVVSARKYRPSTFVSVVGQSHITSTLRNAIDRNQLAHAYLFCGPRGVGKTTCARIFAKNINCSNPQNGEACEACESCLSFNEGRSFSIHELDAASNNSVDDIRNLTDQVRIPPQTGRYSVYIIDEVHMLSQNAFNAFLKTLEEPPAHAIFILATTEKHKILPTILSRCQIYDFNRIRVEDTVGYLQHIASQENVSYDDESLNIIARKADGGMRDALSMFDKVVSFCDSKLSAHEVASTLNMLDYDTYFNITDIILKGDYQKALIEFDKVLSNGFSGSTFISGFNSHLRELLMCKDAQTLPLLEVTGSVAERYKAQSAQCPVPLLFEAISLLSSLDTGYKNSSNQRLFFELGLMKLCGLGQKKNEPTLRASLPPLVAAPAATEAVAKEAIAKEVAAPAATEVAAATKEVAAPAAPEISTPAPVVSTPMPAESAPAPTQVAQQSAPSVPTPEPAIPTPTAQPATPTTPTPTEPAQVSTAPTAKTAPKARRGISISGSSLGAIMDSAAQAEPEVVAEISAQENQDTEASEAISTPAPEPANNFVERVTRACELFCAENQTPRPRVAMAFGTAEVEPGAIAVKVANDTLAEELRNGRFEILSRIAELAGGGCGPIELRVEISESAAKVRPIKVEDKVKFLVAKNPELLLFKQVLDMDTE